jgi:hypothetical protein
MLVLIVPRTLPTDRRNAMGSTRRSCFVAAEEEEEREDAGIVAELM